MRPTLTPGLLALAMGLSPTARSEPPGRIPIDPAPLRPQAAAPPAGAASPRPRPSAPATPDTPVRRAQASPGDMAMPIEPGATPAVPEPTLPSGPTPGEAGTSMALETALYGALTSNPDLVSLRQGNVPGNVASPEAVEVARRFPVTLNPVLWIDVRPLVYARDPGRGMNQKDAFMYFSWRQPIELGHQTTHRYRIAQAAYNQQQWTIVQAELLALVQTYRFFQTAAYRREKLRVANQLADFNDQLVDTLRQRLEAGQVAAADVALAEVEKQATRQLTAAAQQDYVNALTDLRNQIGSPEAAGTAEPLGEFVLPAYIPPVDDAALIRTALQSRPEIHGARAQVAGARAAVCLARGDRIPSPVVGPEYQRNEDGTQFFGFVYITPIPILNDGTPLVRQREAELRRSIVALQQAEQRTIAQVTAAVAKWNAANRLIGATDGLTDTLKGQINNLERLFEENQADLGKLLQARQRLIQLENAQLDAVWAATQAQADLLTALGAPTLIAAVRGQAPGGPTDAAAASPAPPLAQPAPAPPPARGPLRRTSPEGSRNAP